MYPCKQAQWAQQAQGRCRTVLFVATCCFVGLSWLKVNHVRPFDCLPSLQLVDHDTVEISNLASQGYLEEDLGKAKVLATADHCRRINGAVEIQQVPERFRRSSEVGNVVFCAVDSIDVRRLIWESAKDRVSCFVDGRMAAEVLRILTVSDHPSRQYYPGTLFRTEEAFVGPCTAKTTIYSANIAAGLMLAQFTKYLRQLPVDCDVQLNLLSMELSIAGAGLPA